MRRVKEVVRVIMAEKREDWSTCVKSQKERGKNKKEEAVERKVSWSEEEIKSKGKERKEEREKERKLHWKDEANVYVRTG